ncbi:MAG: zinc ribbon domain-containing protein [Acidobacteria bacterium]|nr:zinc ribbon domain-containing protein [Acidobacteriota bacterium]MCW5949867.1 zinc ribbon domain-containing protein [Pyrinomonadaceae bacterium]
MFCPNCGQENPDQGRFCRSCGNALANVTAALASTPTAPLVDDKGKPVTLEGAITKFFTGLAFLIVAIAISFSIGKGWWFWLLIPAFTMMGSGVARYFQVREQRRQPLLPGVAAPPNSLGGRPEQPMIAPPVSISPTQYKTGDLVPPSVTDATTRLLDNESEGETRALPKD